MVWACSNPEAQKANTRAAPPLGQGRGYSENMSNNSGLNVVAALAKQGCEVYIKRPMPARPAADDRLRMIREKLSCDLKLAIKAKDSPRVSTLRLILAAIKDRDIAARAGDNVEGVPDTDILAILTKMIRQRHDSARAYEEAGRLELAAQERTEIGIIEEYLPRQLSQGEVETAIARAIETTGACSIRDMGKVMATLKARHTGQMDFARAGTAIKDAFR